MKERISDLENEAGVDINILAFLSGASSPNIEIRKIQANNDVSVTLDKFYHRSPDYLKLTAKIEEQRKLTESDNNDETVQRNAQEKLLELKRLEVAFKIDVLYLADIFLRIDNYSARLAEAKALFEMGRFSDADALLAESDLNKDQSDLMLAVDFWERRLASFLH